LTAQYLNAVRTVLDEGTRKENRTGIDSISTFGVDMRFDLRDGFPLLTTKRINWFHIVAENLWFLSGAKNIGFLQKHGIKFWDPWADENGTVPSAYGNFWRRFPVHDEMDGTGLISGAFNDQISWLLAELKRNPMSRRLVVSAWAPGNAQTSSLPPCHCLFVLNVQNLPTEPRTLVEEENRRILGDLNEVAGMARNALEPTEPHLCLHLTQRSCDMGLGVPYNIAGYAFLLSLLAHISGMKPGIFHHTLVDAHVYTSKPDGSDAEYDHVPALMEQLDRQPKTLPKLVISPGIQCLEDIDALMEQDEETMLSAFNLQGYDPYPRLKMKVAV